MRVVGLDGRTYQWNLAGLAPMPGDQGGSAPHERCRSLLNQLFPLERKLEEVPLPGSGGLRADFYLSGRKLVVEVHGEQHFKFVAHFHQNRTGFLRSLQRDNDKRNWCELNGIRYCALRWDANDADWSATLLEA